MDTPEKDVPRNEGIGKTISDRRIAINMTQTRLAELLNASDVMVSRWETGKFRPSAKYMKKLAEALQTTTSYLNGETDNPDAIEVTKKTTWNIPVVEGQEQPKGRVIDYSLKMGPWGVAVERRISPDAEIKLEASGGAELKIKALMDAVWENISGGHAIAGSSLDRKRTEALLLVDMMDEEQLDRLNEGLKSQLEGR